MAEINKNSFTYITEYGEYIPKATPQFNMIDNYVYLYHTDTLIVLPTFPESISDKMPATFSETSIMSRSAPIFSYSSSGPRSVDIQLKLHRDLMNEVNTSTNTLENLNPNMALFTDDAVSSKLQRKDYVDLMINELQSIALPNYKVSEKMVDPPLVAIRFGDEIFCKGVVNGGVSVSYSGPILANPIYDNEGKEQYIQILDKDGNYTHTSKLIGKGKYAVVDISFTVTEIDPYDALTVAKIGSFRGLNRTLERNLYKGGST